MPTPVPYPVRLVIMRRHQRGQSAATIAAALGLPARTVRHLLGQYRAHGESVLLPSYWRKEPSPAPVDAMREQALALRREHPTWGAGLIRVHLRRRGSLPTERTLQRWFRQAGLGPAPKGRRRPAAIARDGRAEQPHEVWQIDAKEQIRLRSGRLVSWLRIVDEGSGAVLWTKVFPPRTVVASFAEGGSGRTATRLRPLGTTRDHSCRQRRTLGFRRGFSARFGAVAARTGHRRALERSAFADPERGRRAFARNRQALGRTRTVRDRSRVATTLASHGRASAHGLPKHRRPESSGGVPDVAAFAATLQLELGASALGSSARAGSLVELRRATTSRQERRCLAVPPSSLRRQHASRQARFCHDRPDPSAMGLYRRARTTVARPAGGRTASQTNPDPDCGETELMDSRLATTGVAVARRCHGRTRDDAYEPMT